MLDKAWGLRAAPGRRQLGGMEPSFSRLRSVLLPVLWPWKCAWYYGKGILRQQAKIPLDLRPDFHPLPSLPSSALCIYGCPILLFPFWTFPPAFPLAKSTQSIENFLKNKIILQVLPPALPSFSLSWQFPTFPTPGLLLSPPWAFQGHTWQLCRALKTFLTSKHQPGAGQTKGLNLLESVEGSSIFLDMALSVSCWQKT